MKAVKFLMIICSFAIISGCAGNNVVTLMKASKEKNPIIPTKITVNNLLKGRAFKLGDVSLNESNFDEGELQNIIPGVFEDLVKINIEECFNKSNVNTGEKPHFTFNLSIEDIKLLNGSIFVPNLSMLRVKLEILQP